MISPFFIPRRRVGALRAFKFAIHLKEFGYQPAILSIHDQTAKMTEKEEQLLAGIPRFSISTPFDKTGDSHSAKKSSAGKGRGALFDPSAWIDKHTPLDTWMYLFLLRYPSIKKFAKQWNPEIIWATGDPWSSLWLGRRIAKYLNIPFVADFRDPWVPGGVSLRRRSAFSSMIDRIAERQIVRDAASLVFTSKSTDREYRNYYQLSTASTSTIYNSYSLLYSGSSEHNVELTDHGTAQFVRNSETYDHAGKPSDNHTEPSEQNSELTKHKASPIYHKPNRFILVFFGRFRTLSPVEPVIETINMLRKKEGEPLSSLLEIHSFGTPDPQQLNVIGEADLGKQFIYHESLPPEQSVTVLNDADLLLLTTHRDRKLVIPAKLWDYIYAEPPVLSITPNPEIGEIITQIGKGFHTEPDTIESAADYLAEQIEKKIRFAGQKQNKMGLAEQKQFEAGADKDVTNPGSASERAAGRTRYESRETTRALTTLFDDLLRGENG